MKRLVCQEISSLYSAENMQLMTAVYVAMCLSKFTNSSCGFRSC